MPKASIKRLIIARDFLTKQIEINVDLIKMMSNIKQDEKKLREDNRAYKTALTLINKELKSKY